MRMRTARIFAAAAAVTTLFALTACNEAASQPSAADPNTGSALTAEQTAPLTEPVTLRVASTYNLPNGVVVVANELGYFKEEKINFEVEVVANSQDAIALLAQGRLDVVTGALSAGMLNSVASGLNVRVVSSVSNISAVPGTDTPAPSGLFIRKELYDSGEFTDFADLKGRTVAAVGGIGSASSYLVGLYAEKGGLTLNDVTLKNLSAPDSLAALKSGAVDAAYLAAPFSLQSVSTGIGVELGKARDVYGAQTQSALLFGPNLLDRNPRAGAAVMRALKKAQDLMQGDYRKNQQVVDALKAGAELTDSQVQDTPPYHTDLVMNPATIEEMQRMFLGIGNVLTYTDARPVTDFLDTRFLEAAGVS